MKQETFGRLSQMQIEVLAYHGKLTISSSETKKKEE